MVGGVEAVAMSYASAHEKKQEDKALRNVAIEGSAVLKIVKHCQESQPSLVTGQLLGLDMGSRLEITDCFPFPVSLPGSSSALECIVQLYFYSIEQFTTSTSLCPVMTLSSQFVVALHPFQNC